MTEIFLASKSPRRQELLKNMGLAYELYLKDVDESFPSHMLAEEVAEYIAVKKSDAFEVPANGIIISADTVVIVDGEILGKPSSEQNAFEMLHKLSGKMHKVITGVSLVSAEKRLSFSEVTEVYFAKLSAQQIQYYVENYRPFDKAGAYGIQEWIGLVAIERINGSYTNVVGLPTEKLYSKLTELGCLS